MNAFLFASPLASRAPRTSSTTKRCRRKPFQSCTQNPRPQPVPETPKSQSAHQTAQLVLQRLEKELPELFNPSETPDYSIYSPDVIFEDPLTRFKGINKYASNISFLCNSFVFSDAQFQLFDARIIGDREDTVRTRWYLSMVANLPWRPCISFTGQSDYVIDLTSAKVKRHIDYWDSLKDSSFFSLPAVKDLFSQSLPGQASVSDFGGFRMLRRADGFQVRQFNASNSSGVTVQLADTIASVPSWKYVARPTSENILRFNYAAVMELEKAVPLSEKCLATFESSIRAMLHDKPFATVGERCIYIHDTIRGRPVHELWLELTTANANVDI